MLLFWGRRKDTFHAVNFSSRCAHSHRINTQHNVKYTNKSLKGSIQQPKWPWWSSLIKSKYNQSPWIKDEATFINVELGSQNNKVAHLLVWPKCTVSYFEAYSPLTARSQGGETVRNPSMRWSCFISIKKLNLKIIPDGSYFYKDRFGLFTLCVCVCVCM